MKTLGDLLIGSRVVDHRTKYEGNPIVWKIIGKNHEGDPDDSATLISEYILSTKAFDAKEPKNTNTNIQRYGWSNYEYSNILQWLNSDADAWMWYKSQHEYDHQPDSSYVTSNPYESESGFLNEFSSAFKSSMIEAENIYMYGYTAQSINRKVHLLSQQEVGISGYSGGSTNESRYQEGTQYGDFFYDDTSRKAYKIGAKSPTNWVLRTYGSASTNVYVDADGYPRTEESYTGTLGIRPKCFLPTSTMVSENPDENGIYTIFLSSGKPDDTDDPTGEGTAPDGKWREPKIKWTEADSFNLADYKRIRNNLLFLHNRISEIWGEFAIKDMGKDQSDHKYIWKVQYFNAIEENLETINRRMIIVKNYGFKQTFYNNGVFIGFSELNRIESATLQMKQIIDGWEAGLRRLTFRLGAPKGLYL